MGSANFDYPFAMNASCTCSSLVRSFGTTGDRSSDVHQNLTPPVGVKDEAAMACCGVKHHLHRQLLHQDSVEEAL